MSSSGPYKSRIFNFLNQQSIRWANQRDIAWRRAKTAALWGVQILLYPVYVLVQATRLAGYQLSQTIGSVLPQLHSSQPPQSQAALSVDASIQEILGDVNSLPILESLQKSTILSQTITVSAEKLAITPEEFPHNENILNSILPTESSNLLKHNIIHGIASLLDNHNLVLVTVENQILDILTPEQQHKLQQRIILELAAYWRQWRISQIAIKGVRLPLQPLPDNSYVFPPIRLFGKLINWLQTGAIATTANLFQESQLVSGEWGIGNDQNLAHFSLLDQIIFLDDKFADLETYPLLPPSELPITFATTTKSFIQFIKNKFNPAKIANNSFSQTPVNNDNSWQIAAIIQAAINHFFGNHNQSQNLNFAHSRNSIQNSANIAQLTAQEDADVWLTENDLFGEPQSLTTKPKKHRNPSAQLPGKTLINRALPSQNDLPRGDGESEIVDKSNSYQLQQRKTLKTLINQPSKSSNTPQLTINQSDNNDSTKADNQIISSAVKKNIVNQSEWIETNATPAGYIKHPLEQLLEWLDNAMLWLEKLLIKIWRWITTLI